MHAKIHEDDVHCKTKGKYEELTFLSARISRRISSRGPTAASLPGCRRLVGGTTTLIKSCRVQIPYDGEVTWHVQAANQEAHGPHCPVGYLRRGFGYGRQPRQKIRQVPCRKDVVDLPHRNGWAPAPRLPGEQLGEYIRQRAFHVFNTGPNVSWKVARNRDFWRFVMEAATLRVGTCQ